MTLFINVAGADSYNIHAPAGVPINSSLEYGYRKKMPLFITVSARMFIQIYNIFLILIIFLFFFPLPAAIERYCCC